MLPWSIASVVFLYVHDVSNGFTKSREYQDLLENIECIKKKLTETRQRSQKNCRDAKEYFTHLVSDFQNFRTQINKKLDELEREVIEESERVKSADLSHNESMLKQCEIIQLGVREISSTLESLESQKEDLQLLISATKYLKEIECSKQQAENLSLQNEIRSYLFLWNEQILHSLESCCKLIHLNFRKEERQIKTLSKKVSEGPKEITLRFLKSLEIQHKLDKGSECWVTGSALLTCDTLALADNSNHLVKIVDLHRGKVISSLELIEQPRDLTSIDSNTLVVTCGTKLTFLKFETELLISQEILMDDVCHGITSHQNKLFVTCVENPSV